MKDSVIARCNTSTMKVFRGWIAAMVLASVAAIYPEGHFDHVKELTTDNFDSTVAAEIDAGRTLFVRWIASPY